MKELAKSWNSTGGIFSDYEKFKIESIEVFALRNPSTQWRETTIKQEN